MDILNLSGETFIEEWKRRWLKGSFLSYLTRGSEPIVNIVGKIKRCHKWGISGAEMRQILDQAFSEAYRPDYSRCKEIRNFLK